MTDVAASAHEDGVATTAGLVSDAAHDARTQISTLRAVARATDDAEIAAAVDTATNVLQRLVERLIVVARIELDRPAATATLTVPELLRLAARRATREGTPRLVDVFALDDCAVAAHVAAPGAWLERLTCELLQCSQADDTGLVQIDASCDARGVVIRFPVPARDSAANIPVLRRLAGGVGADLQRSGGDIVVRLPEAISEEPASR